MGSLFGEEQLPLFSEEELYQYNALAGECALHFASEFNRLYLETGSPQRLNEELESLYQACLLLISEYNIRPQTRLLYELVLCRNSLHSIKAYRAYNLLPFDICLQLLGQPFHGLETLARNFTHGASGVRDLAFDLGWLVRRRLAPKTFDDTSVVFPLLQNVEDTLGYWDKSLTLCRSLFQDREAFWVAVESYVPQKMPEQYAKRIIWARSNIATVEYNQDFLVLELEARRTIDAYLFSTLAP